MAIKVLVIIETRPKAIKLQFIYALEADPRFVSVLCTIGQLKMAGTLSDGIVASVKHAFAGPPPHRTADGGSEPFVGGRAAKHIVALLAGTALPGGGRRGVSPPGTRNDLAIALGATMA